MSVVKKAAAVAAGAVAMSLYLSVPATAQPGDNPCDGGFASILCRFIPMAPELDHDIDLTKDFGTDNGIVDRPTTDICVSTCY